MDVTKGSDAALSCREERVRAAYRDRSLLQQQLTIDAIESTIADLDAGVLRVAEPGPESHLWVAHAWIMEAINLYFSTREMTRWECPPFEFHDKVPLKKNLDRAGVRVVPPGVARFGAYLAPGVVLMPGYVNVGARVGEGTMIDTWATVGSCAQIGSNVHLSGGVGIGGVLEPPGATPVIIEDGAFLGSRAIVVEGVHVGRNAVLGANVVLTSSTPIIDVTKSQAREWKGHIPASSVVIPGTRVKQFPAGEYQTPCALIIGQRSANTDRKVSLNAALREFGVAV